MKILLKCVCGNALITVSDPCVTKNGDVIITLDKCKICNENTNHKRKLIQDEGSASAQLG